MDGLFSGPVPYQPIQIPGQSPGRPAAAGMPGQGIEIDQRELARADQQVAGLEVAVADATGLHQSQQLLQARQLLMVEGAPTAQLQQFLSLNGVADQVGLAPYRPPALLQQGHRPGGGDARQLQQMGAEPGAGPAGRAQGPAQTMAPVLDVVALDDDLPAIQL